MLWNQIRELMSYPDLENIQKVINLLKPLEEKEREPYFKYVVAHFRNWDWDWEGRKIIAVPKSKMEKS